MSNYFPSTDFATKDSLPSGDPLKIVRGTEINTEFVDISDAILTKADIASPTFTGNVEFVGSATFSGAVNGIGADDVAYQPAGTGAVARTAQTKLRDIVSVKDFGAVGDGIADDSAAFSTALLAGVTVVCPFGVYLVKNVVIDTNRTLQAQGSVFRPAPGAAYILKMTGFRPSLKDAYFDGSNGNLPSVLGTNAALVVEDAAYPYVTNSQFVNVGIGMHLRVSAITGSSEVTKGSFSHLKFDTIGVRGILVYPNVNTCTFDDIRMFVGVEFPDNRPKRGCIGFQVVSTGSLTAAGGHMIDKVDIEQAEHGFQFTDAELIQISNCFSDSLAGSGYQFTGNCRKIKLTGCFAGTCLVGFDVAGTSYDIWIDSATAILQGVVPPWWAGPNPFFNVGSPFDLATRNTASVRIGSWFGDHKIFAESTATLAFEGGEYLYAGTATPVTAGTTTYFGPDGASSAQEITWIAPRDGVLVKLDAQSGSAPGSGQSYTYTTRLNLADTSQVAVTSGGSSFASSSTVPLTFVAGQNISVKLSVSGAAIAGTHRLVLLLKYF